MITCNLSKHTQLQFMDEGETPNLKQAFKGRLEGSQYSQGLALMSSVIHTSIIQPLLGPRWTFHGAGASGQDENISLL